MNLHEMKVSELIDRAYYASLRERWDEALDLARVAIEKEPENFLAYKRLGMALWNVDQKDDAIASMKKSIELKPEFASAYYNLACFYAQNGIKSEMLHNLKRAIELDDYTDYRKMATDDRDFDSYCDDEEFENITEGEKKQAYALQKIFDSGDFDAISHTLLQVGKEIPLEAVDWVDEDIGANIGELLENHASELSAEALLHVFKTVVNNHRIDELDGFSDLMDALQSRIAGDFDALLVEEWKNRYTCTDACHLCGIDYALIDKIGDINIEEGVKVVIWGLNSHGKDAVQDYKDISSFLLETLPESHDLRKELVETIDTLLHGKLYKDEDFEIRQHRVRMALPPPSLNVEHSSDDWWAREKAELAHFHPTLVVRAAAHMSIQESHPEIVELARESLPRLCEFVNDASLPVDTRIDALEVVKKLGDDSTAALLVPALSDRSIPLLQRIGEFLHDCNIVPAKETKVAVDYLIGIFKDLTDPYEIHDLVCALRYFQDDRVVDILIKVLENTREAVRREALYGLGIQKATGAIPLIVKQLRDGSDQCVTAAAVALDAIGGEAQKELENEDNYSCVLKKARTSPRWAIKALNYFKLPRVNDDLIELFLTTPENEAFEHLARGMSQWGQGKSIPELLSMGVDRYRGSECAGRYYVQVFRSVARKNDDGPAADILKGIKGIISETNSKNIEEFANSLAYDAKYCKIEDPSDKEREAETNYSKAFIAEMKQVSPEAEYLARAMFQQVPTQ